MLILPIQTPLLREGDDLASRICARPIRTASGRANMNIRDGDIVAVSSKAVATVEGAAIELSTLDVSGDAKSWAAKIGEDATFIEAVLRETARMHGSIIGASWGALLTELQPQGFPRGTLLVPNAGLDRSNVAEGFAIGWPRDPVGSVRNLKDAFGRYGSIAILLTDSGLSPRRLGVTAFALAVSGFAPTRSLIGSPDLFGKALRLTEEALADQLATAANAVMGNASECTPAAIIRDHGLAFTDYTGWVPGIERGSDLYHGVI